MEACVDSSGLLPPSAVAWPRKTAFAPPGCSHSAGIPPGSRGKVIIFGLALLHHCLSDIISATVPCPAIRMPTLGSRSAQSGLLWLRLRFRVLIIDWLRSALTIEADRVAICLVASRMGIGEYCSGVSPQNGLRLDINVPFWVRREVTWLGTVMLSMIWPPLTVGDLRHDGHGSEVRLSAIFHGVAIVAMLLRSVHLVPVTLQVV